ncbi:hypothetical protein FQU23_013935 [Flavobacterium sp. XN-5]|uniref:hypothetical protein n=1 Tax=Flavobacterium sp. XN-5 TaxID=2599390 RepID=UPI0011C75244|nr:hypothetical protein [Flavobacterium sp. XN-5]NGY38604.1 hypothetical protein [Flavobacterium sp. XN-5]
MKLKKIKCKIICALLTLGLLFQSCVVYQNQTVSLDDAVASDRKVLITKVDGAELKLIKIEKLDGKYYGHLKVKGGTEKVNIIENDVKNVHLKNKTASTIGNIGIVVGSGMVLFATLIVVAIATY